MTPDLSRIRMLLTDVDGVLTDGRIYFDTNTMLETKAFHVHDAAGLIYWHRSGRLSGFLSGRESPIVESRARELGVHEVRLGHLDKLPEFDSILANRELEAADVAYIGDDLLDLPVLERVGFSAAPANARPEVKERVHHVCEMSGGSGALREIIEIVMKAQGSWSAIVASMGRA